MKIDMISESKTVLIRELPMRRSLEKTLNGMLTSQACFINEDGFTTGGLHAKLFVDRYTDGEVNISKCIYYHPDYIPEGL